MKTLKISALILLAILTFSCDNDNDPTNNVCDENYVSTPITNIFSTLNGYDDLPEFMDLETHEYQIKILADGEICSIAYQNPSTYLGSYNMEIINNTALTSYSGVHSFSQSQLDYQTIATPLLVTSGDIITIKRTILPGYSLLSETIGRVLRKSDFTSVPYPIALGNVEFLNSNFYGAGGPIPDFAQPYISFGFKVN